MCWCGSVHGWWVCWLGCFCWPLGEGWRAADDADLAMIAPEPGWWTGGGKGYAIHDGVRSRHPCCEEFLWRQGDQLEVSTVVRQ
jgi:hypothetical protein